VSTDGTASWPEFALTEVGPAMKLPRHRSPPRNIGSYRPNDRREQGGPQAGTPLHTWDLPDYIAVLGIIVVVVGLLCALMPWTRSGGILVPLGFGLMTIAAFDARRKDAAVC
jgi:hypothetical protein